MMIERCCPESALHEAWSRADSMRARVDSGDGERYRVLYSGMPGGSFGPDFRNAVLESADGSETVGDVEVHVNARDWYSHGHDSDARYGNVVFHAIAAEREGAPPAVNVHGLRVPTIRIDGLNGVASPTQDRETKAVHRNADSRRVEEWLDAAGAERFAMKVNMFRLDIDRYGPDLALQISIFECLGYPRNRRGFRHLAKRMPWAYLTRYGKRSSRHAQEDVPDQKSLSLFDRSYALLAWAAGLGVRPSWSDVPRLMSSAPEWVRAAGRPANHPARRLRGAAWLVSNWLNAGGPMRHALDAIRGSTRAAEVRDAFRMDGSSSGLGAARAGEIVVNVVLPFAAAWAESRRDSQLYRLSLDYFSRHPSLPDNSLCREARRVLTQRGVDLSGRASIGARRQQGLIHIYKMMILRPRASRQLGLGHRVVSL